MMAPSCPQKPMTATAWRCRAEVAWAVAGHGIVLVRKDTGQTLLVEEPAAALWDLCSRQVPFERIVRIMGAITAKRRREARQWIARTLGDWQQQGWLVDGRGDG